MIKKRKIEIEIIIDEEKIQKYPNYKFNYANSSEFIDSLTNDIVNMTSYEYGYEVNITKFGNLIVEEK